MQLLSRPHNAFVAGEVPDFLKREDLRPGL
jgi:hypothetical protein